MMEERRDTLRLRDGVMLTRTGGREDLRAVVHHLSLRLISDLNAM